MLQLSQAWLHFLQNQELNLMNFSNVIVNLDPRICGIITSFVAIGPKNILQSHKSEILVRIFTRPHFIQNQELNLMNSSNAKINLHPRICGVKTSFGSNEPKTFYQPKLQNHSSNFHKQRLILSRSKR